MTIKEYEQIIQHLNAANTNLLVMLKSGEVPPVAVEITAQALENISNARNIVVYSLIATQKIT